MYEDEKEMLFITLLPAMIGIVLGGYGIVQVKYLFILGIILYSIIIIRAAGISKQTISGVLFIFLSLSILYQFAYLPASSEIIYAHNNPKPCAGGIQAVAYDDVYTNYIQTINAVFSFAALVLPLIVVLPTLLYKNGGGWIILIIATVSLTIFTRLWINLALSVCHL